MPHILVIDDDAGIRTALKILLELERFDVTLAEDGRAGLQLLDSHSYDLVMVDAFMPGMSGFETIKVVRALRPRMPIIVMSGLDVHSDSESSPDFVTMATRLGADAGIRKPFGLKELMHSVRTCLDGARVVGQRGDRVRHDCASRED
jgi:DNA-binding response OmpR family regulator